VGIIRLIDSGCQKKVAGKEAFSSYLVALALNPGPFAFKAKKARAASRAKKESGYCRNSQAAPERVYSRFSI
jgi:hypothetical protein